MGQIKACFIAEQPEVRGAANYSGLSPCIGRHSRIAGGRKTNEFGELRQHVRFNCISSSCASVIQIWC